MQLLGFCHVLHRTALLSYLVAKARAARPALRQSRMETGTVKDTRGPAAEGEGAPERGGQAAGDCRAGTIAGRHEGCLQKKGSPSGA